MSSIAFLPIPEGVTPEMSDGPVAAINTEIRVLTPEEVEQLQPVFDRYEAKIPDPNLSFVMGVIEDGKPTETFLVVQCVVHAEPMHVEPRHRTLIKSLAAITEREIVHRGGITNVYLFAPPGDVQALAEVFGMRAEPWSVMSKTVGPIGEPS